MGKGKPESRRIGVSRRPARRLRTRETPAFWLPNFLTKRLNVWLRGGSKWLPVEQWKRCGNAEISLDDFAGQQCWAALDLAEKKDIAALCVVFRNGKEIQRVFRLYLSEDQAHAPENRHFQAWEKAVTSSQRPETQPTLT